MTEGCLAKEIVLGFVEGQLSPERAAGVDEHVASCPSCRQLLLAVTRGSGIGSLDQTMPAGSGAEVALLPTVGSVAPIGRPVAGLARGASVGRYMILDVLGQGGMGVVYAAFDPELDRKVAVKVLRAESAGEDAAARLLREGRAIARLAHPNVVAVFDVGTHEGSVFVAMELVDGTGLDGWLETARAWREVVGVFLQAGAGLIAAHAAGMVHRDFKPANVLMGKDGRPRVTDFGLARLETTEVPSRPAVATGTSDDASRLTLTGAIMGTPAYMAPEQFEASAVDAKTDQFSFAVALYEGLYGARPFAGTTLKSIYGAIVENRVSPAPTGTMVPAWLRQVVLRGLRASPAERYPTLEEMLAALRHDPAIKRRRIIMGAAGAGMLGIVAVGMLMLGGGTSSTPCQGGERALDGAWDAAKHAELARAFGAINAPYAKDALAATTTRLDRYAADWRAMKTESCEATQVRHEQTEDHQGLRNLCLEDRMVELRALTGLLATADEDVVKNAVRAAGELPPVSVCADLRALAQRVPPPADPVTRARVDVLRGRLVAARALGTAGKYQAGYDAAKQVATEAGGVGYKPIHGEALLLTGELAERAGHAKDAEQQLTLAVQAAQAGRDDRTAAQAWIAMAHAVGPGLSRNADALTIIGHAAAALERLGGDPLEQATLDAYRGLVLSALDKHAEARTAIEKALESRRRLLPANSLEIAGSLADLGNVFTELGKYAESRIALVEALAIREKALGPNHPDVAASLHNLGNTQVKLGDFAAAVESYRRSLAIREKTVGPDHPDVAALVSNLGVALRMQSHHDEAIASFERAIAITTKNLGPDAPSLESMLHNLGGVLALQRKFPEAEAQLDRALALAIKAKGPDHTDVASLLATTSTVYVGQKRWADASNNLLRAIAIDEKALGPDHPGVAEDRAMLGALYQSQGKYPEAIAEMRKSLAITEKTLGKDHVDLAITLSNLAGSYGQMKQYPEALATYQRALVIDERTLGKDNPDLIWDLTGIGGVLIKLQRFDEAIAVLERALVLPEVATRGGAFHSVQFYLGKVLWEVKQDRPRALRLVREAREGFVKNGAEQGLGQADRWLAAHR